MITELEYKVLKALTEEWKSLSELSRDLGEEEYKVLRTLGFLNTKGLIDLREEVEKNYVLTDLGEKYLREGLPEKRILDILEREREIEIKDLEEKFDRDEVSFSLGFLKRSGAIDIVGGKVIFKKRVKTYDDILKKVKEKRASEDEIKLLIGRKGILKLVERREYYARINENGKKVLMEFDPEKVIYHYTKDVLDSGVWKKKKFSKYDINMRVPMAEIGRYNKYLEFLDKLREELVSMGFEEMENYRIVVSHFWNLDSLFVPQDHPAGDISLMDTFFLKDFDEIIDFPEDLYKKVKEQHIKFHNFWDDRIAKVPILVSHDTTFSSMQLLKAKVPGKYFIIDKVFRYDTIDAKHFIEFTQLDGIVLGKDLSFIDLLGVLKEIIINVAGAEDVKFYPAFFPFTEPSVEVYAKHKKLGWIEVAGAGIFRKEMLEPFGIDVPVLAWGMGIERLAMIYLGIDDIRELHTKNIRRLQD
ncbi:MAG: hypothetical protein BXU00_01245 [Candidatus Nanoclepta minutus]|uniref:phenylalanine--tRNA ligase n=1 Tax=Candidatus Nanoclepta minutus TaxID=1940235 RepID=A0A397WQL5_9ARCH|nr:MAG: hypothetical protein BXU00_01245 [Candidatus Nanoclepta minutus]